MSKYAVRDWWLLLIELVGARDVFGIVGNLLRNELLYCSKGSIDAARD